MNIRGQGRTNRRIRVIGGRTAARGQTIRGDESVVEDMLKAIKYLNKIPKTNTSKYKFWVREHQWLCKHVFFIHIWKNQATHEANLKIYRLLRPIKYFRKPCSAILPRKQTGTTPNVAINFVKDIQSRLM